MIYKKKNVRFIPTKNNNPPAGKPILDRAVRAAQETSALCKFGVISVNCGGAQEIQLDEDTFRRMFPEMCVESPFSELRNIMSSTYKGIKVFALTSEKPERV